MTSRVLQRGSQIDQLESSLTNIRLDDSDNNKVSSQKQTNSSNKINSNSSSSRNPLHKIPSNSASTNSNLTSKLQSSHNTSSDQKKKNDNQTTAPPFIHAPNPFNQAHKKPYTLAPPPGRPKYALSSLIASHRQSTGWNGMLWVAELGILIWFITIWVLTITHPSGIFTFHPTLQSLSILFFYQGIIVLQPTQTPASKRTGLLVHETFQILGSLSIIVGTSVIIYNKMSHSAPHFTSWHGLLGFISALIVLAQSLFGALIGFETSRDYILGDTTARKLWKFHRASGYLLLCLMTVTVLTVTKADWVVAIASKWSIWTITISPIIALLGILSQAKLSFFYLFLQT